MIKRLIINADDYGMTRGTTLGILLGHAQGLISSTTVMMSEPYALWGLSLLKDFPKLGVGVHLCVTAGRPLTNGHSFVDKDGTFKKRSVYPNGHVNVDQAELYVEWKAQIEAFIKATGHKPDHLDSHHHIHLYPEYQEITIRLAKEYDLPVRQEDRIVMFEPYARVITSFNSHETTMDKLKEICEMEEENVEIMTHSALIDQELIDCSSYNVPRAKELDFWLKDETRDYLHKHNIRVINYQDLKSHG